MKNKKKHKLEDVGFFPEYQIIGICTPLNDIRLVMSINKVLGLTLKKIEGLSYFVNDEKSEPYGMFYYNNEDNGYDYYLLSNKNTETILIPEYKNFDYLFFLKSTVRRKELDKIICNINKIENIQTSVIIDATKVKNINNLYTDLELHLNSILKVSKQK